MLHAIADQVVDGYIAVADAVQDDIDEVEIDVFSAPSKGGSRRGGDAGRIYQLKREVLEFKRAVTPLMRPMQLLSERPMRLVDPDIQKYFRDVADHLARVHEQVVAFDDLLNSILPGQPRPGIPWRRRGHAQDHLLGGDLRRAHDDRGDLRHELQVHAGAGVEVRLPHGHGHHGSRSV
ncbi:hypothetical protein GCM10020221_20650 [Streptomyces thioluteus]|uniref:Uncharacterized protein n=1 Tax=Streptomyces thioluteus TaxID=66431 RepID=A0ABN3WQR8_STRTU